MIKGKLQDYRKLNKIIFRKKEKQNIIRTKNKQLELLSNKNRTYKSYKILISINRDTENVADLIQVLFHALFINTILYKITINSSTPESLSYTMKNVL